MKRFFFWFFIFLLAFVLFFISLNFFDSRADPGLEALLAPVGDNLPKAHLEAANVFYLIWGFAEAPETDVPGPDFATRCWSCSVPTRGIIFSVPATANG
jgi:hypothetical protein